MNVELNYEADKARLESQNFLPMDFPEPGEDLEMLSKKAEEEKLKPKSNVQESSEEKGSDKEKKTFDPIAQKIEVESKEQEEIKKLLNNAEFPDDVVLDKDEKDNSSKSGKEEGNYSKKDAIVEVVGSLIKEGIIVPFEDQEDVSKLSKEDLKELIKQNIEHYKEEAKVDAAEEILNSMPEALKLLNTYVLEGGDIKEGLKVISRLENISEYDISSKEGQKEIVREYLSRLGEEDDDIDMIVESLEKSGKLYDKAKMYKEKLEESIKQDFEEQVRMMEEQKKKELEMINNFKENIYSALKNSKERIKDINLSKEEKAKLYKDLTEANYDSIRGYKVNLISHLLEKYQFIEPKPELIIEVAMLLSNPEKYKESIRSSYSQNVVKEVTRKLKLAEQNATKDASRNAINEEMEKQEVKKVLKVNKPRGVL